MSLARDLRGALRLLATNPGLSAAAVLTLALGMGVNLGLFGIVDAVLLRPLGYPQPDRLVLVWGEVAGLGLRDLWLSGPEYRDLVEQSTSFADLAILRPRDLSRTGVAEPEPIKAVAVTGNFFRLLGGDAAAGRTLGPDDDRPGEGKVAVLSHGAALRLFGEAEGEAGGAVGRTLELNGEAYQVVGVMPADFRLPPPDGLLPRQADLWVPIARDVSQMSRDWWIFNALARLRPGVSPAAAEEEARAIARRVSEAHPDAYQGEGWSVTLTPYHEHLTRGIRPALLILLALVGLVLLIACANVASLLLALSTARSQATAVRAALGAGRWELARRALVEAGLLAALGTALGLALALWSHRALVAFGPGDLPRLDEVRLDLRLLAFALAITLAVSLLAGLGPALRSARPRLAAVLKAGERGGDGGRAAQRALGLLVAAEVGLALVPLIATGLLGKSMLQLLRVDPGFQAGAVMTCKVRPPQNRYREDDRKSALYDGILERVRALPGVRVAGAASSLPMSGAYTSGTFAAGGAGVAPGQERFQVDFFAITPGYLEALGIALRQGRAFGPSDTGQAAPVALVDEVVARRIWPGANPVGKQIRLLGLEEPGLRQEGSGVWYRVVGVTAAVRHHGLGTEARGQVYFAARQMPWVHMYVAARATGDPAALAGPLRRAVREADPELAAADLEPLAAYVQGSTARPRLNLLLAGTFAALALVLAGIGTYGVMAYVCAQRLRDMGIHLALGAPPERVLRRMVWRGLKLGLAGLAAGLLAAAAGTRVLAGLLYGVQPYDGLIFALAPALLAVIAAIASYVPARRVLAADPLAVLRR